MKTFNADFFTRIEAARKRLKKIFITGFLLFWVYLFGVLYILSLYADQIAISSEEKET
jgi:cell division septal protein FtsQ